MSRKTKDITYELEGLIEDVILNLQELAAKYPGSFIELEVDDGDARYPCWTAVVYLEYDDDA